MAENPARDRPQVPEGYGVPETPDGMMAWADVNARLANELHYWMSTTRPDGRPHVVPRWGAWIDGALYYDGSPDTIHARNARSNSACNLHIGDGREAIILEGTTTPSEPIGAEHGATIAAEISRKYGEHGYTPEADAWSGSEAGGMMIFTPVKALAWNEFPTDLTRFRFS
jgi:hypothetical protein